MIRALQVALHRRGDERWSQNWNVDSSLPGEETAWVCDVHHGKCLENFELLWEPPGEPEASVFFLDITRHEESWRPLLEEAEQRLKPLTTNGVTLKPSPYMEKVKALVPWKIRRVQIFRAPKQRRLPTEVSQEGTQHRGAALLQNGKFTKPVRVAIFFYGDAPATSLNPQENELPEQARPKPEPSGGDPQDMMRPHQPGYRDISFPGVELPDWLKQVLRRVHCNLGHPPKETLVRHLAAAKASEAALKGARHLRCEVCLRVNPPHQPRVSKAFQARRFNDRLSMDIIYLKDIRGGTHMFLNCVDDATCYQAASRLLSRSEENVVANLVNGWFCYFGPPDELTIDAEGAFRGMRFESLHAQLNVDVRCIPPDSHWQLGKAERHGQALRYNASRLINQFAALTVAEVNVCVASAVQAKNRLMRRSGSSPNQWVFGRDPKLPGALLSDGGSIESAQLTSDSERLMQIESIRTQAMVNHHEYEASQALRAALLRKGRPYRGEFYPGQKVAYFRKRSATQDGEGSLEGYRQGVVLSLDRNPSSNVAANIWIRNSRGRLVQASPEQCRPIFGEEEWWTPDPEDMEVLRKFDKDVQLHPRAFRHGDHPGPSDDLRAAEAAAAAVEPEAVQPSAEEPLQPQPGTPLVQENDPEQAPRPTPLSLDPAGRPVLESPMFSPLMLVPPTPRSAPGTPRTRARSRSAPRRGNVPGDAELPEQDPTSSNPAPSGPLQHSENAAFSRLTSGSDRTNLPGQDPSSNRAPSGPPGNSRRTSLDSIKDTSGQAISVEPLHKIVEHESLGSRGLKRSPSVAIGELAAGSTGDLNVSAATHSSMGDVPLPSEPEPQAFLLFCKDCGEQYQSFPEECGRCGGRCPVTSVQDVVSWLDEIKEREAFDKLLGVSRDYVEPEVSHQDPQAQDVIDYYQSHATTTARDARSAVLPHALPSEPQVPQPSTPEPLPDSSSLLSQPQSPQPTSLTVLQPPTLHRLDVLRRHARGQHLRHGWDGSPAEVPGVHQQNAFLTTAYAFGNADQEEAVPEGNDVPLVIGLESTAFTTTKREASLSESLAQLLFKRKDFQHETCHQLLQIVNYQKVDRDCLSSSSPSAGSLTLGYFSHGRQQGLTRATRANQALLKYVNAYLRHHGLQGRTSSVFIGKNIRSRYHKDVKSVDNWSVALGDYVGGRLWIEEEYNGANPGDFVKRSIKGKKVFGKFHDNYGKVIRFNPDLYHGTEDYVGDRYVITAYQTRLADQAPEQDLKELERFGFRPPCRHVAFTTAASTDKEPEPAKVSSPSTRSSPVRSRRQRVRKQRR